MRTLWFVIGLVILECSAFGAAFQGGVIASNDTGRLVVPTNFFQANIIAGSNMLFEITNKTGLIIHSTAVGGSGGSATNAQPPSENLTNWSNVATGAVAIAAVTQPASANLTNWSGTATSGWATVGFVQTSTNGFVDRSITNGFTDRSVTNGFTDKSVTNGFVGTGITNGLWGPGTTSLGTGINASNVTWYSSAIGNIPLKVVQFNDDTNVIQQWEIRPRPSGTVNVMASMATNGALTLAGSLTASAGNFSGALLSTSASASNSPAANELPSAQWVRSLFNNGVVYYPSTVIDANATNTDTANQPVYKYQSTIPTTAVRQYSSPAAGTYIGSVVSTNTFSVLQGPIDVHDFIGFGGSGSHSATIHPELYYSYDKTNWYGDYTGPQQSLVDGTNLLQWVISFPTITATNANGFYIERRFKVDAANGTETITFWIGTNTISGASDASHIGLAGPNSALGNAYLANNQTFTGVNTFNQELGLGSDTLWTNQSKTHYLLTNATLGSFIAWIPGIGLVKSNTITGAATLIIGTNGGAHYGRWTPAGAGNVIADGTVTASNHVGLSTGLTNASGGGLISLAVGPGVQLSTNAGVVTVQSLASPVGNTIVTNMSGDLTLTTGWPRFVLMTPDAARNASLPAAGSFVGDTFTLHSDGGTAFTVTLKTSGGTTVASIPDATSITVIWDGSNWLVL